jgi:hypothetical protein
MKDAGLRVRVEKELREEFVGTCRLQGLKAAAVLRDFMRDYVQRESGGRQGSLLAKPVLRRRSADKGRAA